ncbi:MAG TPA: recombinase family protein [Allocoleopsis sp.]
MVQRAAIYCRVSTDDQSCERQERDLLEFANRAGYETVGVWKETASGAKDNRPERKKILALAQARKIDAVLVTELSRWGRSLTDLIGTVELLQSRNVSLVAQTGLTFDLTTAQGRLIASIFGAIAEFEAALTRERIKSGLAAARARGKKLGRQPGLTPKIQKLTPKVLRLVENRCSYRQIARDLRISKTTVSEIVKRHKLSQNVRS